MAFKILNRIKKNHSFMMLLCCLIPVIIAGILYYIGFKTYATLAIMLLCPVLHYFMMKDMHKEHKENEINMKENKNGNKN